MKKLLSAIFSKGMEIHWKITKIIRHISDDINFASEDSIESDEE